MNNDIRKLVDDNWEDIKELIVKKAEAEQKPESIWDLEEGDSEEYYFICFDGDITLGNFSSSFSEKVRDIGNAFLTREEAEFECERRKIETIMRKYSRPFKNGLNNYCIYFYACESIRVGTLWAFDSGIPCFETKEIAQKTIDEIGEDRLKKYWFGITE